MNSKRKIEINIVEVQTYKILIQINSNVNSIFLSLLDKTKSEYYCLYLLNVLIQNII